MKSSDKSLKSSGVVRTGAATKAAHDLACGCPRCRGSRRRAGLPEPEHYFSKAATRQAARRLQAEADAASATPAAPPPTTPQGDLLASRTEHVRDQVAEPVAATAQATEPEPFGPWLPCILTAVDSPFPGWVTFRDHAAGPVPSSP